MRIYQLRNCGIIITKIYEKTAKKFLKKEHPPCSLALNRLIKPKKDVL